MFSNAMFELTLLNIKSSQWNMTITIYLVNLIYFFLDIVCSIQTFKKKKIILQLSHFICCKRMSLFIACTLSNICNL